MLAQMTWMSKIGETLDIMFPFEANIKLIQEKFPMASIYISTIIPRK